MMAIKSFLKLVHDLASLKILNNLRVLNAVIAVNVPPDKLYSKLSMIYSTKEIHTIKQSNIFRESLK